MGSLPLSLIAVSPLPALLPRLNIATSGEWVGRREEGCCYRGIRQGRSKIITAREEEEGGRKRGDRVLRYIPSGRCIRFGVEAFLLRTMCNQTRERRMALLNVCLSSV